MQDNFVLICTNCTLKDPLKELKKAVYEVACSGREIKPTCTTQYCKEAKSKNVKSFLCVTTATNPQHNGFTVINTFLNLTTNEWVI